MIADLDRHHGAVLRQIVLSCNSTVTLGVADTSGRVDTFSINSGAFQIKHCTKRLSPWRFTYLPAQVAELRELGKRHSPVWVFLVCGQDGVVGLSLNELDSILEDEPGRGGWIRVSRSANSMYRVGGARGDLARAKSRGVEGFASQVSTTPRPLEKHDPSTA